MTEFSITPAEFLSDVGAAFKKNGNWLTFNVCPFCDGGSSRDRQTFIVHAADGNFSCSRSKCGVSGSFWKLIEFYGRNPRDYTSGTVPARKTRAKKSGRRKFIYGRS